MTPQLFCSNAIGSLAVFNPKMSVPFPRAVAGLNPIAVLNSRLADSRSAELGRPARFYLDASAGPAAEIKVVSWREIRQLLRRRRRQRNLFRQRWPESPESACFSEIDEDKSGRSGT